jgi:hypothetical protein
MANEVLLAKTAAADRILIPFSSWTTLHPTCIGAKAYAATSLG